MKQRPFPPDDAPRRTDDVAQCSALDQEHWQSVLDSVTDLLALFDSTRGISRINRPLARFLGLERPGDAKGLAAKDLLGRMLDGEELVRAVERAFAGEEFVREMVKMTDEDHYFRVAVTTLRQDGEIWGVLWQAHDMTPHALREEELELYRSHLEEMVEFRTNELTTANAQLAQSHSWLESILKGIPFGVVMARLGDLKIIYANQAAIGLMCLDGRDGSELLGTSLCRFFFKEKLAGCVQDELDMALFEGEATLLRPDRSVPVLVSRYVFSFHRESYLVISFLDITERKAAEEALRSVNADKAQLLSAISSILIGLDAAGRITTFNEPAAAAFGLSPGRAAGTRLHELPLPFDADLVLAKLSEASVRGVPVVLDELAYRRTDGKAGFLRLKVSPVFCASPGAPARICGHLLLADDVTELKVLESQLLQSQKLEAIGQLAAGIAHEINTPTQYVGDNNRFLEGAFADMAQLVERLGELCPEKEGVAQALEDADWAYLSEEIPRALAQSQEGVSRIAKIVLSMKQFAHPGAQEMVPMDLNKALEATSTISRNVWKYVAEMELRLDPNLPMVRCLPDEMNQVFLNIIVNAAHAIEDKVAKTGGLGRITVVTALQGDQAVIRISDTGTGIPEHARAKVFDPFFTTKAVGRGTGQGLNIAYSVVVEKHKGSISFDTETGKGTTFEIRLPVREVPA